MEYAAASLKTARDSLEKVKKSFALNPKFLSASERGQGGRPGPPSWCAERTPRLI
jgi:hypothetical protein